MSDFPPAPIRGQRTMEVDDEEGRKRTVSIGFKIKTKPGWLMRLIHRIRRFL